MDLDTLIVTVFCSVDDALAITLDGKRLHQLHDLINQSPRVGYFGTFLQCAVENDCF